MKWFSFGNAHVNKVTLQDDMRKEIAGIPSC